MCGIAGIVNFEQPDAGREFMPAMLEVMRHRGPDGSGMYSDDNVVFGHVRLSIIDLAGSKQPLCNEDKSIWVTFNGEIYNYKHLRENLLAKGHLFRTKGDTETLVHLYEEYGADMVDHLQGMFAFAIWDTRCKKLLLARDRIGIKPLYYCKKEKSLLFASEPKAIIAHPNVEPRLNRQVLWHYLTYRTIPAPQTLFEGIQKLKPGHVLTITPQATNIRQYWDIPLHSEKLINNFNHKSDGALIDQAERLLFKCVERRLISDVPLGAFLSGGVDSSLIVAMMSKLTDSPVRTYSVGFDNFSSSETPYADIVAKKFATDHHELILAESCFAEHLEELTWMRDSPLSEPADIPLHLLSKMASKDVKLLLSGEGCDELFAGYPKYAFDRFAPLVGFLPQQAVSFAIDKLSPGMRRVEIALRSLSETAPADRWAQWFSPFTPYEKQALLGGIEVSENPTAEYVRAKQVCSSLDAMLYADCKLWLPENLLDRGDRMTMAASVEGRVPFLDHEFIEYAFALPVNAKIRKFDRKWLIKQVALRHLPRDIVYRKKVGFAIPLAQWFCGQLKNMCYDRICGKKSFLTDFFSASQLRTILDEHSSLRKDNSHKIWTLLGLSIWADVACKKSKISPRSNSIEVLNGGINERTSKSLR
ncbi:MAG: asparagine synthase (glutamine-hydrolyzing) [Phycisphaerae bacterium]|nr:asparagine synthase (glutamine-hydrolyzing) [Phycisphaerae bacterium]